MKDLSTRQRVISTIFGVVVLLGVGPLFIGLGAIFFAIPILIVILIGGSKLLPDFWRTLGGSALAGAIGGILVLGPGLRLAMRVVAIAEPSQTPEFSIGGTMGIIVVIGVMFGTTISIAAIFIKKGLRLGRIQTSLVFSLGVLAIVFGSPDLRNELITLGYGGWFNGPMFGLVGFLAGLATQNVYARLKFTAIHEAPPVEAMA